MDALLLHEQAATTAGPAPASQGTRAPEGSAMPDGPALHAAFGARDSFRLNVEADWIYDFADADELQVRVGAAWFFFDNVELAFYFTGGYVWQPESDAGTYGLDMELRWHVLAFERWSVFASVGGGVMGSTASVPATGSPFNFTPSIGGGVTFEVAPDTRAYVGARWFHVSNGGTYAANPGRDNLSLWAGLSFAL